MNILEVTFQVAFWSTLAALVFGLRVAAAVRAAATLSGGEARRVHIARVRALGRRVAAGIWLESDFPGAACGPLRDPVMRELHLEGAATPRSPARDLARPRSA